MIRRPRAIIPAMSIDVRPFEGDPRDFYAAGERAFHGELRDDDLAVLEPIFEHDRAIGAYDGDVLVGTAGILSFDLAVPGGVLPAAGVTTVGVHATHRRRGILRRMMRAQLDAVRARGEPLAVLWASEGGIYQRFGYGLASIRTRMAIERDRSDYRAPWSPTGTVRFVAFSEARRLFPAVHDAVWPRRPGFFSRTPAFWDSEVFHDPDHRRHGAGPAWYVVHERSGEADGYARYRVRDEWDDRGSKSTILVSELVAANAAAHLGLWRFILDVDLVQRIEAWNVPADDPIILNAAEPRRLGIGVTDALWLRVVDLPAALAGRGYASDGRLVLDVADQFCGWNQGRWSLRVRDGVAEVEPTSDAPDVSCDITDIGAAYLGAFSFTRLADALRARELSPGGVARADALFRTERPPWCPLVF